MNIALTPEEAEFLAALLSKLNFGVGDQPDKQLAAMQLTVGLLAKLEAK